MPSASVVRSKLAKGPKLSNKDLTNLCKFIGLAVTGTKTDLIKRLRTAIPAPKLHTSSAYARDAGQNRHKDGRRNVQRILSVDMGIRNLAYCRLSVKRAQWDFTTSGEDPNSDALGDITVEDWRRFALSEELGDNSTNEAEQKSFSTPELAKKALTLLRYLILENPQGPPDTILIERQRWRSSSTPAIQEWTLRVNTMEAMLWAGLELLRFGKSWNGHVFAVDPGMVQRFCLADLPGAADQAIDGKPASTTSSTNGKRLKQDLVRSIMQPVSGNEVPDIKFDVPLLAKAPFPAPQQKLLWADSTLVIRTDFFYSTGSREQRKAIEEEQGRKPQLMSKTDDLADCLLQGVSWIKWEQNRRLMYHGQVLPEEIWSSKDGS